MRILVVMLSVGFAGTERHAVELANELSRQGHDIAMVLRRRPSEPHRQVAYAALRSAVCPRVRLFVASRAAPVMALWRALTLFRPEIIHAHHERAVRLASRYSGRVPVIATIHMHFNAKDFSRCDGLICLTEAEKERIPPSFSGLVRVICNWVLPHDRPSEGWLASRRSELAIAEGEYVVGAVCRLEAIKGVADLILAFHEARLPASRLVIVGDGSLRGSLEQQVAGLGLGDRVVFTGFRPDVRDWYYLFNLFVLNSIDDPFPLVVLEAAASGLPVIATAMAGSKAMAATLPLELVEAGRPALLAAALRKTVGQPVPVYDMSNFTVAAKARDTVAAYRQVISATRRGSRSKSGTISRRRPADQDA